MDTVEPEPLTPEEHEMVSAILVDCTMGYYRAPTLRVDWIGGMARITQSVVTALKPAIQHSIRVIAEATKAFNRLNENFSESGYDERRQTQDP